MAEQEFLRVDQHPAQVLDGLPAGPRLAAISTLAYSGFLAGPPILGWFAEATSLRVMFLVVVLLCLNVVIFARAASGAGVVEEERVAITV